MSSVSRISWTKDSLTPFSRKVRVGTAAPGGQAWISAYRSQTEKKEVGARDANAGAPGRGGGASY
jgi:hypothetical protein